MGSSQVLLRHYQLGPGRAGSVRGKVVAQGGRDVETGAEVPAQRPPRNSRARTNRNRLLRLLRRRWGRTGCCCPAVQGMPQALGTAVLVETPARRLESLRCVPHLSGGNHATHTPTRARTREALRSDVPQHAQQGTRAPGQVSSLFKQTM